MGSPSQAAAPPPRHRIQSYTNKNFRQHQEHSRNLRRNLSAADSVGTNSLLNEIIGNYKQDRDFSRKLDTEFGKIKKQDECRRRIIKLNQIMNFRKFNQKLPKSVKSFSLYFLLHVH